MRWKQKPESQVGDRRVITKFLLFPRNINREFRWLETAKIEQEYISDWYTCFWINRRFID